MRTAFCVRSRIAAQLTHPHILPLIDSGEDSGSLFYVMPYIDGETLRVRLARAANCRWLSASGSPRHVLEGLAYAHARGVVHRDIKPENVLLIDRHALVADFGVAKGLTDDTPTTATTSLMTVAGTILGTPAYMAPEQIAGEQADHRADLYAVGVLGYEMLTGRLPFHAATPQQMLAAHLAASVAPIQTYRPAVPVRLAQAVTRCLEKHPSDRWQAAGELLAHLEAMVADGYLTSAPAVAANQLVERQFTLSERVCRKLNRATLDPASSETASRMWTTRCNPTSWCSSCTALASIITTSIRRSNDCRTAASARRSTAASQVVPRASRSRWRITLSSFVNGCGMS